MSQRQSIDRRAMALLSSGHLAVDFAQGAVPAMLPFLVTRFDLSYTLAAVLMLAVTVSSSLVQPLFGLVSDRRGAVWLLAGGLVVAGAGVGLAAVAEGYALVVVGVTIAGVGVAAFHPEGAKFAAFASGAARARGMSFFTIGGNVGYGLAPVVLTPFLIWWGTTGALVALAPAAMVAGLLHRATRRLRSLAPAPASHRPVGGTDDWRGMGLLAAVIAMRSTAWFGLLTFVPLWWASQGHSKADGNHLLSAMLLAGAAGTLLVGRLADRLGLRRTMLLTQGALTPLILVFLLVGGPVGVAALVLVGICVVGTFGVTLVLSQAYLPTRVGLASGLAIGLAMGLGGIASIVLGTLADTIDLRTALIASACAPLLGLWVCFILPAVGPGTGRRDTVRYAPAEGRYAPAEGRYAPAEGATTSAGGGST